MKHFCQIHVSLIAVSFLLVGYTAQKILRIIFIYDIWQNAPNRQCVSFTPEESGWYLDGYMLEPLSYRGMHFPNARGHCNR